MGDEKLREDTTTSAPAGATRKLIWFGAGSALWIIAATTYGLALGRPDAANTLGDFLAGVFAPAAFAMLFAAVWIQSDELREQRKELILTRREFEYNRKVMEAQAEEAKKQAEYIGKQTLLMDENRIRDRNDTAYRDAIKAVSSMLKRYPTGWEVAIINEKGEAQNLFRSYLDMQNLSEDMLIGAMAQYLRDNLAWIFNFDNDVSKVSISDISSFDRLSAVIQSSYANVEVSEGLDTPRVIALELDSLWRHITVMEKRLHPKFRTAPHSALEVG